MDRDRIRALLADLDCVLREQDVTADLFVVGGAAMALAYRRDRLTDDVDAAFAPAREVREAARRVAEGTGLAEDWLNDAVKGFLHPRWPRAEGVVQVVNTSNLVVSVASARQLLAMKVAAARIDRDEDDIKVLAAELGLVTADQVLQAAEREYGQLAAVVLGPKSRFAVEAMFG